MLKKQPGVKDTARPFSGATGTGRVGDQDSPHLPPVDTWVSTPPHRGHDDRETAHRLWSALAPRIAGRHWMRLLAASGKYDDGARLTWRKLPDRPAAVMTHDRAERAAVLVFDFDPPKGSAGAVTQDVDRLTRWLAAVEARWFCDTSPRGGVHVYVPLAESVTQRTIRPLYRELRDALPTLDPQPMINPVSGCITVPGSRCRGGGFRTLVGDLDHALDALSVRSAPGMIARLRSVVTPALFLSSRDGDAITDTHVPAAPPAPNIDEVLIEDTYAVSPAPARKPLPRWISDYCAQGIVPPHHKTPSEARQSVLAHYACRGWSFADLRATQANPDWRAFWATYTARRDGRKRLQIEWHKAISHARDMADAKIAENSSRPAHKPDQPHTGGMGQLRPIRWKLAAARRWILESGEFSGHQTFSALAVVTALAYAISMTDRSSAAVGGRWLAVAAGVLGDDTTRAVLQKLLRAEGSPVRLIEPWSARTHAGDRLALVDPEIDGNRVRAAEWEAFAARPEPVDSVWSELGLAAWWIHTVLVAIEPTPGAPVAPRVLAAAARVSLSTVHRAAAELSEHGLLDRGHGWVSRTGRTPRRVPLLAAAAEHRRAQRIARHQRERAAFWEFWDLVHATWTSREITAYATVAELAADAEDYWASLAPGATAAADPGRHGSGGVPSPEDATAIKLLQTMLGATLLSTDLADHSSADRTREHKTRIPC